MLHHISIAVANPFRVAKVLSELVSGQFFEFPIYPGAYIVVMGDPYGSALEILPQKTAWMPNEVDAEVRPMEALPSFSDTHVALSVTTSRETIEAIGNQEGWLVRWCDRGPFQLMELWVENRFMIELLTPEMTPAYLNFMQPDAYAAFLTKMATSETTLAMA
jgi:hypothetical protein